MAMSREKVIKLALKESIEEMKLWLSLENCDCPPEGHICGRPRLLKHIKQAEEALTFSQKKMDRELFVEIIKNKLWKMFPMSYGDDGQFQIKHNGLYIDGNTLSEELADAILKEG